MEPIAPGGCYPPDWPTPPGCWPPYPLPPEPDPESLDVTVDWMTYSHHELYQMVHSGLDLTGAMAVSAQWARLGEELADIGAELGALVDAAATSWEGEAADLARDTLAGLTHWAADAGTLATKVSGCVSIEVDNATNARDEMPAPPPRPTDPAAASSFTSGGFADAAMLTADPAGPVGAEKALHAQAARAMERFQQSSREVYGTVPQFSPPQVGLQLLAGPGDPRPTPPQPRPQPESPTPVPGTSRGPVADAPSAGGPARGGAAAEPPARAVPPPPPPTPRPGTAEPTAAPNRSTAASGRPGVSGMPAGVGGSRGGEDTQRTTASYLKEDEDVWGMDEQPVTPPVIGEVRRRA